MSGQLVSLAGGGFQHSSTEVTDNADEIKCSGALGTPVTYDVKD